MIVADFADFCLCLAVLIDDLWDDLPAWVTPRGEQSKSSNSALLTMLVVEECMGWDEEPEAISQWRQHRGLFPHQPHRTRLNRRRHRLTDALTLLRLCILTRLDFAQDRQCVSDNMPVPVLGFPLVPGRQARRTGANIGRPSGA